VVATPDEVRALRERLLAAGSVVARADGRRRSLFPVAIGVEEGLALRDRVRAERAQRTLETGLGFAIATLFCEAPLANGSDPRHVAMDPYQFSVLPRQATTYRGVGIQVLEDAGVRDVVGSTRRSRRSSSRGCSPRVGRSTSPFSTAITASKGCSST
jgi:hypothetical protein